MALNRNRLRLAAMVALAISIAFALGAGLRMPAGDEPDQTDGWARSAAEPRVDEVGTEPSQAPTVGTVDDDYVMLVAPQHGDVAQYAVQGRHGVEFRTLQVSAEEPFQDGEGVWHAAWSVTEFIDDGGQDFGGATTYVESDGTLLGVTWPLGVYSSTGTRTVGSDFGHTTAEELTLYGEDKRPCGLWLQAGTRQLPYTDVQLPGVCPVGAAAGRFVDGLLVYSIGGRDVAAYRADMAFPAWMESTPGQRWELQGFTAGAAAQPASLPSPVHLPAIALANADRMGPSEEGNGFTPSFAATFKEAADDPLDDRLRVFLEENPDWYVAAVWAAHGKAGVDNHTTVTYDVLLNSAGASYGLHLDGPREPGQIVMGALDPILEQLPFVVPKGGVGPPYPVVVPPTELPRVVDLLATFEALEARPATAWSYSTFCDEVCVGTAGVWGGDTSLAQYATFGPDNETTGMVLADPAGDVRGRMTVSTERYGQTTLSHSTPGDLASPPAWSVQAQPVSAEPPSWVDARVVALGFAGFVASLLYGAWPWIKGLGAAGLFSRVHNDRLLEHPTRRALADAVRAQPGIHHSQLGRQFTVGHGALEHHLGKLVQGGLLQKRRQGGCVCYFPTGVAPSSRLGSGVLRAEGAQRVLRSVADAPGANATSIAGLAGLDLTTVTHHVHRLEEAGLVHTLRAGRELRVTLTQLGVRAAAGS